MGTAETENLEVLLRQQENLRAVIESISRELELQPLLTRIVRDACELIGADNGTIGLVDEIRNTVRTAAVYRMPPDELGAENSPGIGLSGQVLLTKETLILERYGEVNQPTQKGMLENTVIGLPIFWQGRMTGFFGIGAVPPRRFDTRAVEMLSQFARHAAIAIENARRYAQEQRRTERFALIARIGSIITANLRLEDLLQNAADAIHELLGYQNVAIPLLDLQDPDTMVLRVFGGKYKQFMEGEYRLSISEGIMGAAARSRVPVLVNDVMSDPRHYPTPGAEGITAELAVPILLGDQLLGILNVESAEPFTDEDTINLKIISDQLAVAIENSRLFEGKQQALEETQSLYQTSKRISTATDVAQVIDAYLEQMSVWSRYNCAVLLEETEKQEPTKGYGIQSCWTSGRGIESLEIRLSFTDENQTVLLDAGQTVLIPDVARAPAFQEIADTLQGHSLVLIPLMARGFRIGVIVLSHPETRIWQESDLRRHQATATQLATVIDSRRQQSLVNDRGQQLAVLEERQRLARELHDSVTQLIFSITLIAQTLSSAWQRDSQEGERRIQRLLELSRSALAEMRDLLQELKPASNTVMPAVGTDLEILTIAHVRRHGLVTALKSLVKDASRDGRKIQLNTEGYQSQTTEQEEAFFRITQEALSNAAKYAKAKLVRVRLYTERTKTHLTITDDGIGFRQESLRSAESGPSQSQGGLGLITMRERAEALGGAAKVTSEPGQGTVVEVILPATNSGENH